MPTGSQNENQSENQCFFALIARLSSRYFREGKGGPKGEGRWPRLCEAVSPVTGTRPGNLDRVSRDIPKPNRSLWAPGGSTRLKLRWGYPKKSRERNDRGSKAQIQWDSVVVCPSLTTSPLETGRQDKHSTSRVIACREGRREEGGGVRGWKGGWG